ncbi:hypothetical protein DM01DRAFT_1261563, partial [Hesseltinella vesiculosa]
GGVTWVIFINARSQGGYQNDAITMFLVPVCLGLLAAMAFYRYYLFCVITIPRKSFHYFNQEKKILTSSRHLVLGGLTLALFICCWQEDLVIAQTAGRLAFIIIFPFFTVVLVLISIKHTLLLTTSFSGAFSAILGIDLVAHTGYISGYWLLVTSLDKPYQLTRLVYVMLTSVLILAFLAYLWQLLFNVA